MKQALIIFILICTVGLVSCRKDSTQLSIKQYDQQQIQNYIAAHGLNMVRDTSGGDTTGIYYQILNPGTPGTPMAYSDKISFVFTIRTLDGSYVSADTISNHYYDYVGHVFADHLPLGLQSAIHNILKYPDASFRVLIPSHLAYGPNGTGSGSSQVANNRIKGNQSLDYYIHAINNFQKYDDQVIQNYMRDSSLTGYTKMESKQMPGNYYYYKVITPATTNDPITDNSTVAVTYTGQLFNGTIFNQYNVSGGQSIDVSSLTPAAQEALENFAVAGTKISVLIPSTLGYGLAASVAGPAFSCLRFTFIVDTVTP